MSTYEVRNPVTDLKVPPGYRVDFCQIRGYDSPDRWYEAFYAKNKIGEYGTLEDAIQGCLSDKKVRKPKVDPKEASLRKRLRDQERRYVKMAEDVRGNTARLQKLGKDIDASRSALEVYLLRKS